MRSRALRLFSTRHLLAIVVLVALAAVSVVTSVLLRGVVHNQERRLLNERATELSAYLKEATTRISSGLAAAGEVVAVDGPNTPVFTKLAKQLGTNGATVAVAQRKSGSFVTIASMGTLATAGRRVSPAQEQLLDRAASARALVYAVEAVGGHNHFISAVAAPRPATTVAFTESVLPRARPVPTTKNSPYRELDVALYAGTKPDPKRLILISGGMPKPSAHPAKIVANFGIDPLLVVAAGRHPLVGSFAQSMPWIALGGGLVLALLVFLVVEILSRRRSYALALVDHRTAQMYSAQLAAEAANRSKSEFLSRMSHELRTPLNAVLGFSQLLELDELSPEQEQSVAQITRGGRHLLDLINEILDISQIETGTLALSPESLNVSDLIRESLELVRPLARHRGVHVLGMDEHACDVYLFADRQRLKQILLNLLGNGIKYNRDGGTVSITCVTPAPGSVRLQVTDTGPGIPKEQYDLLFTPFERLGAERTTVEGTGIGLALSRRLTEVMGGTIGVESTVGRGSTFWVEFPVVEGPVQRAERLDQLSGTSTVVADDGPQRAVLHIEDNLSNTKLVEHILAQRPGVTLISAMQGRLGLELARQHRPVLILLDLNLADMAGEEVLHLLREDPATTQIPVVIVSADAMPRQVQRLLAAGATAYLTKPIDVRLMLEVVDRSVEAQARRDEPVIAGMPDEGRE
jgi:signal transduction histidine kinase/ActR/RegA family two-component response regulator